MENLIGVKAITNNENFTLFELATDKRKLKVLLPYELITHKVKDSIFKKFNYKENIKDYCNKNNIDYKVYFSY